MGEITYIVTCLVWICLTILLIPIYLVFGILNLLFGIYLTYMMKAETKLAFKGLRSGEFVQILLSIPYIIIITLQIPFRLMYWVTDGVIKALNKFVDTMPKSKN